MLLVVLGSQPVSAPRIVNTIINSNIKDEIIIQYACDCKSLQLPKNIKIFKTIPIDEMDMLIDKADIISCSGTGTIITSLKKGKKVIIFAKLPQYNEVIDNHSLDMKILADLGYCEFVIDEKKFEKVYNNCKKKKYKKFISNNKEFVYKLQELIER